MRSYTFVVFLCSLGVDSVASIIEFFERYNVHFSYGFIVVNKTPLSHPDIEHYATILTDRVNDKYCADCRLIITEPDSWNLHRPPYCRYVYNKSKEYCIRLAYKFMPEMKELWRKLLIETGHTSLDCINCLRRR